MTANTADTLGSRYDAFLLDLDGTVWEGGRAINYAVETLNQCAAKRVYVTNNASKAPAVAARQLSALGLDTTADDVFTSAQAAILLCAKYVGKGDKVLVLGTDSFRELASDYGYHVVTSADEQPAAVLHGHNPDTGWAQLSEAALAIRAGARYIASNLDTTLPLERGLHVGNGSMVAAVTSATGVVPESAGKPEPAMFTLVTEKIGATAPLAIGDRLDTDIAGGVAAGVDTLQVVTGVSGHREIIAAPVEQRATYLAADMRALFSAPADLVPQAQGGFTADFLPSGDIVLRGGTEDSDEMHALRTVAAVAWATPTAFLGVVRAEGTQAERAVGAWR
ncbi:HAD-IIA family hydrolase [Staphylococcus chromogenes]|nr:HAD-IIA family hydrolase [Staphylococcus chromogenes]